MSFLKVYKRDIIVSDRNFGLDLVRSIAIVFVLLSHLGIEDAKTCGVNLGRWGVEIFFVLSGFLIGQILIKNFSKSLTTKSVLDFWVRRWFRTLPLYYLVIILKFIFVNHSLGYKILVYFFFLQNNFVGIDFMPVTWSLVVEEWFYLSLPVLLFLFFYKRTLSPRRLILFIIGFILIENIARFGFVYYTNRSLGAIMGNFPFRLDSMMCGVLLACLKINFNEQYRRLSSGFVFVSVLVCYLLLLYFFGRVNLSPGLVDQLLWTRTIWFLLNSFCIALLLPFLEEKVVIRSKTNILRLIITCVSIFSYCTYLIHMEVYNYFSLSDPFTSAWWFMAAFAIITTFVISGILYGIYEKPMTDLRERFQRKNSERQTIVN